MTLRADREDLDQHDPGCDEPACVEACRRGRCRCAGCDAHREDREARKATEREDLAGAGYRLPAAL